MPRSLVRCSASSGSAANCSTSRRASFTSAIRRFRGIAIAFLAGLLLGRVATSGSTGEVRPPRVGAIAVAAEAEATEARVRTVPQLDLGGGLGVAAGNRFAVDTRARLVVDLENWQVVHYWPRGGSVRRFLEAPHLVAVRLYGVGEGVLDLRTGRWVCRVPGDDILIDGVLSANGETCFLMHAPPASGSATEAPVSYLLVFDLRSGRARADVPVPVCEACERFPRSTPFPYTFVDASPGGATLRLEARHGCPDCRLSTPLDIYRLGVALDRGEPAAERAWRLVRTLHLYSEDLPDDLRGRTKDFRSLSSSQEAILGWTPRMRPDASHDPGTSDFDYRQMIFAHPRCGLRSSFHDHGIVVANAGGEHLVTFVRFENREWIAFGSDSVWDGSPLVSSHVLWFHPDGSLLSSEEVAALRRPEELRQRLLAAFQCGTSD